MKNEMKYQVDPLFFLCNVHFGGTCLGSVVADRSQLIMGIIL